MNENERYSILDNLTGEVMTFEEHYEKIRELDRKAEKDKGYFEMTSVEILSDFIECAGSPAAKVLAVLLRIKWKNGRIEATQQDLIKLTGASKKTVNMILQKLQKHKLLLKVRQGHYVLHPGVAVYGNKIKMLAEFYWKKHNESY